MRGAVRGATSRIDLTEPVEWLHPLNRGLVSWWLPLNGRIGNTLFDLAGTNHGTLTNGPTWVPGPGAFGAIRFDGTDDVVVGSAPPATGASNRLTVACWVNPAVLTRGDLVTCWTGGLANSQFDLLYGLTSGKPQFFVTDGTVGADHSGTGPGTMAVGRWSHVVGTYNGSAAAVYLDGVLQSSRVVSKTLNTTALTALRLGDNGDGTGRTTGAIGDTRLYNRALSASEVWGLYDQSRRGHPDALRRWSPRARLFVPGSPPPPPSAPPPNPAVAMLAMGLL